MKKSLAGLLAGLIVATTSLAFAAPQAIKLIVNGKEIKPDVPPQIINGRIMVSPRSIAGALGAVVSWDDKKKALVVTSVNTSAKKPLPGDTLPPKKYSIGSPIDLPSLEVTVNSVDYSPKFEDFTAKSGETFAIIDLTAAASKLPDDRYALTPLALINNINTTSGTRGNEKMFLGDTFPQYLKINKWVRAKVVVPIPENDKLKSFEINNLVDRNTVNKAVVIVE